MTRITGAILLTSILTACGNSNSPAPESTASNSIGTTAAMVDIWTPAAAGDTRTLKSLLAEGADVDSLDPEYQGSALEYAAAFGQVAAVEMLLDAGADPNVRAGDGGTPPLGAAFFGRAECLKLLLDAGADPTLADEDGITAFAALGVSWEKTKETAVLMEMPLGGEALESGRGKCWKLLGPMVDIWTAAATGEITALRARLAEGIDVNAPDPVGAMTPLAIAASWGQFAAMQVLLEAGANPNARNGNGSTPSLGAAFLGRPRCLKTLLDAGADPSLADESGTTTFTALFVPWPITKGIADALMISITRNGLDAGRKECGRILKSR